ncbi:IS4 family transposase [Xanthomonas translucens pv. translucens]|nr:IS4 family transposase [Xanthomonas translucens pv. translucens]
MRASQVLQRCLDSALSPMHALRRQTLLLAVESLLAGRRLVLIDLARSWLGAERIRAPLKRLDRLLSNPRLHAERERLYAGMVRWLVRSPTPVIAVDWCRLKGDGRWHLLRAAVPVGGRTLTLLEQVFPERELASPKAERRFLERLKALLPEHSRPILITDAGFRAPWCRTVERLGWQWITRLRHRTQVKPVEIPDQADQWVPCRALYALTRVSKPRDLGVFDVGAQRSDPGAPDPACGQVSRKATYDPQGRAPPRQAKPAACAARDRTLVADGLQADGSRQRRAGGGDLPAADADRTRVPRSEIASLRPSLRGQPHPQARAHRDAVIAARAGDVRVMAGGHGLRSDRRAGQTQSLSDRAQAVLSDAIRPGGSDTRMVGTTSPRHAPRTAPVVTGG